MRRYCEYLCGLRYELRIVEILVDNPCFIYGDNQTVLRNTSILDSMVKKKAASVCYHFVHNGVSAYEWHTTDIDTKENHSCI